MTKICIFCKGSAENSNVEHILPESLGGKDWAVLDPGVVCAKCNQYFGSKVEPKALGSFPFLPMRVLLGIPTKKAKWPRLSSRLGEFRGMPFSGLIGLDPADDATESGVLSGGITRLSISTEPKCPVEVTRLLLKMGLETRAMTSPEEALSTEFDPAREFARAPKRGSSWWFCIHTDERFFRIFTRGVSQSEWCEGVSLDQTTVEDAEVFVFRFLGLTITTSMVEAELHPSMFELPA